jgi:HEAT repeat protein
LTKQDYGIVLKQMNGAIRMLEMYPPEHPATMQAMEKPFATLQEIFKNTDQITISQVEDKVIINGKQIEGTDLLQRLLEEFENQNLNSLTINKYLTKDELNKFLGFFVKPLGKSTRTVSLPEYIQQNQIRSITVDQLRYELVTDDEVVVKSDVVEGADLKAEISKILKDNPDLLREMLLSKKGAGEDSGRGGGRGEGAGSGEGVGSGFKEGSGTGDLRKGIEEHVKKLSDEDLLSLLAASLESTLSKRAPEEKDSGATLNEVAELVNKLLQDREKGKLLPRVKKILSERGIVKKEHLDFLFEEKWLKSQEVLDELMRMIDQLGTEKMEMDRFTFMWERVLSSEETKIKSYAIDKLLSRLDSEDHQVREHTVSALEKALNYFSEEKMDEGFSYIYLKLWEKLKDQLLPAYTFKECSRLMKTIFSHTIRQKQLQEAKKILQEYHARLSPEMDYPDEVRKAAWDFIREVSDGPTLDSFISQMKEGTPFKTLKVTEQVLEYLDGVKVAKKLLDVFTSDDRATRISSLRVLGRLGKSSISAFSELLSHPRTFTRKDDGDFLVDEKWYKVRNVIYVLGNITDDESTKLLSKLGQDPDVRVRMEVVKALEKIDSSLSRDVLLSFLNDGEEEVRRAAISSLTTIAEPRFLEPLKQHFKHNHRDWKITLSAISRIAGEESTKFLLKILQKDEGISHLAPKQKDEIKITVLNMLGRIDSSGLAEQIEKFVKLRGKGLVHLLVKDKVTEAAIRALEMIESRSKADLRRAEKKGLENKTVS